MFASDNSKSLNDIVWNESNIPFPRRETSKRAKGTNKPPQLLKYIDTIIKASIESNPKVPAERRSLKHEKLSLKRIENESRRESIKRSDILENEKTKNETKEKDEDDTVVSLEIEKCLQKLYPNPYELEKVYEFRNKIAAAAAATETNKSDMEGLIEENVVITADIEIKEDGCELHPDSDSCVVSFSFKDSEDDSSSRGSDYSSRNVRTIWIENLRKSLDSETTSSGESGCENAMEEKAIDNKKLYQPNELDDLWRIYDMMDKATESFQALSSRSLKASESAKKNNNLVQFLSELNISNAMPRTEAKNPSVESLNTQKHKQEENWCKSETIKKSRPKSGTKRYETTQKERSVRSVSENEVKTKEDKEAGETSQKIEEVLDFMYNCLLKLNEGGNKDEEEQKQTPSTTNTPGEIVGDVNTHIETSVNEIQIVESQNELGGYTEEAVVATNEESRLPRPVLPLSAKMRKRNNDSHDVIKKALETEEKLLASEPGQSLALPKEREVYPGYPELTFLEELQKRSFVICVNSLPRKLRTINASAMALTSLSISLSDTNWCANQPKHQLEELCIAQQPSHRVSCHAYKMQEDGLLIATQTAVMHVGTSMSFRVIYTTVREEESSTKHSECLVDIHWATHKPVHDSLEKTIEETEECVFLLEQSSSVQTPADNPVDNKEADSDKKRLHDLLLRTYNLQTKLHDYLHKMNSDEPSPDRQQMVDKEVSCNDKADTSETDEKVRDSLVYWFLESSAIKQKSREVLSEAKIDHATSYDVQVDDRYCQTGLDDNEDDRSSTYSFKSSNDFSESELSNKPELSQPPDDSLKNVKFLQKIFNEIELFKNNTTQKKETFEGENETQLMKYEGDTKPPAKALKTVFKGKDSLTELTIGLKDVPMTHVSNISVEKKKYSQNHTKISICISKDQPDVDVRPSLNQLQDDASKLKSDDDDDDDDDFQSVASTISNPQTNPPMITEPKKSPKHRFEFYQKMNVEEKKEPAYAVCRYKALEPLKQALTDMQIKVRNIRKDSYYNSNEYYRRALKLAKMSDGFCQNCGNRAVIPEDTYGCYRSIMPRRYSNHRRDCYFSTPSSSPNFYSFRASGEDITDRYYDLNASSCFVNSRNRSFGKNSLDDMPVLFGRI